MKEPKARYDFNRYGGQLGGPIMKNKLFFGNFERQTTGQNIQYNVCTPTAGGLAALKTVAGLNATNLAQYLRTRRWLLGRPGSTLQPTPPAATRSAVRSS